MPQPDLAINPSLVQFCYIFLILVMSFEANTKIGANNKIYTKVGL